jgi:hypothetical protein
MIELLGRLRANLTGKTDDDPMVISPKAHLHAGVAS